MARPDKAASVAELAARFSGSDAAVLTEYRGLTVSELKELRRSLGTGVKYAVVKNTLTKIAAREAGITELEPLLEGPSAIAFVKGDPVDAAKSIRDFAKAHPALVVKGGILDGKLISPAEIRKLADLESREVLLAKLAGAMKASLTQAVYLFAAPLSQAARVIAALQEQKSAEVPAPVEDAAPVEDVAPVEDAGTDTAASTDAPDTAAEAAPAEASAPATSPDEPATAE